MYDREVVLKYLEKKVHIELKNGHYFEGIVLHCADNLFTIRDKNSSQVDISYSSIFWMKEVRI